MRSRRRGREEPIGFTSNRLSRAGGETRTLNPRFTKPMLCRLSYASNLDREILHYTASLPRCNAFPHSPKKNLGPLNPGALTARQSQLLVRSYPLPRRASKGPLARDRFGSVRWNGPERVDRGPSSVVGGKSIGKNSEPGVTPIRC
jgi:hypothetical protein